MRSFTLLLISGTLSRLCKSFFRLDSLLFLLNAATCVLVFTQILPYHLDFFGADGLVDGAPTSITTLLDSCKIVSFLDDCKIVDKLALFSFIISGSTPRHRFLPAYGIAFRGPVVVYDYATVQLRLFKDRFQAK